MIYAILLSAYDETLIVNDYPNKMPESVLKIFRDKDKELCARMYKDALPDEEAFGDF